MNKKYFYESNDNLNKIFTCCKIINNYNLRYLNLNNRKNNNYKIQFNNHTYELSPFYFNLTVTSKETNQLTN